MSVFLAVFDPLTSFNHGLWTVSSAQHPVLLCSFVCVCHLSNKRCHHTDTSGSSHSLAFRHSHKKFEVPTETFNLFCSAE